MSWSRKFFDPIILPDGSKLVTLNDAGEYIQALPASVQKTAPWQTATEALLLVVKSGDPMLARMAIMLALYPRGARRCSTSPARNPGKSDRAIAVDAGVGLGTVQLLAQAANCGRSGH